MKPKTQITPPDWMTAPQTVAVMAALNKPGDKQTLFVGGCVRNALLDRAVSDIDLATIYTKVAENAPERLANNPNWKAKVRQVLNQHSELFASCQRGIWALTA